ncbi:MAG: helix-turn-helix transcriptional regulator [Oscillospiraceae bacterium]
MDNIQMGERFRAAREAAGYTQERLAELLDVSAQYISGIERGTVGLSVPTLKRACAVLLVSSDTILRGSQPLGDTSRIVARLQQLPAEHIAIVETIVNKYAEGIAVAGLPTRKQ